MPDYVQNSLDRPDGVVQRIVLVLGFIASLSFDGIVNASDDRLAAGEALGEKVLRALLHGLHGHVLIILG